MKVSLLSFAYGMTLTLTLTAELFLGPRYSKLADFMRTIAQSGEHTTRTVFGPNGSYFTSSPSGFAIFLTARTP